jgi:hypothetical protein
LLFLKIVKKAFLEDSISEWEFTGKARMIFSKYLSGWIFEAGVSSRQVGHFTWEGLAWVAT